MNAAPKPVVLSWSGGKDSALAFHELSRDPEYRVAALLSYIDDAEDRIVQHRVPTALIRAQADALGVALWEIRMPPDPSNAEYERHMAAAVSRMVDHGIHHCAFGDLYLRDVRDYREAKLAGTGVEAVFPLWGRDTGALAAQAISLGFAALIVCVDTDQLDGAFAGRNLDAALLADLPDGVDPCGENGEFHSFVHDGPDFRAPVAFEAGTITDTGRFALYLLPPP
jgi:uncharacterized protein (TIGR00290 family)